MPVMRSVFYVPGNNESFIQKSPSLAADIITLDLEDSVPPAEKVRAREMTKNSLKVVVYNENNKVLDTLELSK